VLSNSIHRYAGLAAKDKLLNQHLNATIHKYTDTTQILEKRKKKQKEDIKYNSINYKYPSSIQTTTNMEH
jgi:hypothetical protein